jgi:purine-nucleoside phosphorylase
VIKMATPHINAEKGDIAKVVLMPGDPLRAKLIADKYLTDVMMFNNVRNMFGYTGYYNGKKISVMGSGMGMPSMGIYSYELYKFFDVEQIIRIGSCGATVPELNLFDVVLVDQAYSDSTYAFIQSGSTDKLISGTSGLTKRIEETAQKEGIKILKGNIYSTDVFDWYQDRPKSEGIVQNKCVAAEMETFALFHNAKVLEKEAACLLTVVDSLQKQQSSSSEDREKHLNEMIELALKTL